MHSRKNVESTLLLFPARFRSLVPEGVVWKFFGPLGKTFPPGAFRTARRNEGPFQTGAQQVFQKYILFFRRFRHDSSSGDRSFPILKRGRFHRKKVLSGFAPSGYIPEGTITTPENTRFWGTAAALPRFFRTPLVCVNYCQSTVEKMYKTIHPGCHHPILHRDGQWIVNSYLLSFRPVNKFFDNPQTPY